LGGDLANATMLGEVREVLGGFVEEVAQVVDALERPAGAQQLMLTAVSQ
jgi:hypothetical protein